MELDSPYLIALGGSGLPFAVDVVFGRFFKEILKAELGLGFRRHDKRSFFDHQLDRRILSQTDLIRERFRDTEGQAVAPFLYTSSQFSS
jgi:hypothetical protein